MRHRRPGSRTVEPRVLALDSLAGGGLVSGGLFGPLRHWANNSDTVRRWRTQRYELFERLCDLRPEDRILDVGAGWVLRSSASTRSIPIVALDLNPIESGWLATAERDRRAGGCHEPSVRRRRFDVAFSNSVIEHVPRELQPAFASEISRVAKVLRADAQPPLPDRAALPAPLLPVPPRKDSPSAESTLRSRLAGKGPVGADRPLCQARICGVCFPTQRFTASEFSV